MTHNQNWVRHPERVERVAEEELMTVGDPTDKSSKEGIADG